MSRLSLKNIVIGFTVFGFLAFAAAPAVTQAACVTVKGADGKPVAGSCCSSLACESGETCKKDATKPDVPGTCEKDLFGLNPVGNQVKGKLGNQDLRETAANLINVLLGLLGLIAVVIVLAGGFKWMTAGGNEDKVGEARKMIFSGIIGLAIILSAWAISLFVINQLSTATGGNKDNIPTDF